MEDASARLATIRTRIARAAALAGRGPEDIHLIAVSKTRPWPDIAPLIAAGQIEYGENRVQEAEPKWGSGEGAAARAAIPGLRLHFIGRLQSNKAAQAVAMFDAIHSVDRLSLVAAIARASADNGRRPDCFIQVNIGEEAQKGGCPIDELEPLLDAARAAGLVVAGLMAVPPLDTEPAPYFALLGEHARRLGVTGLSMGMSDDFESAVMIGATHIRIGTALFGARRFGQRP